MTRLLSIAASLRLTFPAMLALVLGVLVSYRGGFESDWWVSGPLVVLAVNLAAALVVHPRFRRQPGLLCFHLALLAVLVLGATEQLRRFEGRVELLVGERKLAKADGTTKKKAEIQAAQLALKQLRNEE